MVISIAFSPNCYPPIQNAYHVQSSTGLPTLCLIPKAYQKSDVSDIGFHELLSHTVGDGCHVR